MRSSILVVTMLGVLARGAWAQGTPEGDQVGTQIKGAAIGAGLGAGSGFLLGLLGGGGGDAAKKFLIFGAMGIAFGTPAGVQMYCDNRGGTGKLWGTVVGASAGMLAGGLAIYGTKDAKSFEAALPTLLFATGLVMAGPIIGYRATRSDSGPGPGVEPTMLMVPIGSGSF